jgi:dienelactone hydrolase
MRYERVIKRIKSGELSRADMIRLRRNADQRYATGDADAKHVIEAINNSAPADEYILFMGFCLGSSISVELAPGHSCRTGA